MHTDGEVSDVCNWNPVWQRLRMLQIQGSQVKMVQTADLNVRQDGPAKLDIEIKSDWLLICFTFVMKSPGYL